MFERQHKKVFGNRHEIKGAKNTGKLMHQKKYTAKLTTELNRSVNKIMDVRFNQQPVATQEALNE